MTLRVFIANQHGWTNRRPITSRLNWPIRPITRVQYHQLTWYNSLWLWRWLPHRLSKRQSLSTTTVLFRTTFTRTIILNLLFLLLRNLSWTWSEVDFLTMWKKTLPYFLKCKSTCTLPNADTPPPPPPPFNDHRPAADSFLIQENKNLV